MILPNGWPFIMWQRLQSWRNGLILSHGVRTEELHTWFKITD